MNNWSQDALKDMPVTQKKKIRPGVSLLDGVGAHALDFVKTGLYNFSITPPFHFLSVHYGDALDLKDYGTPSNLADYANANILRMSDLEWVAPKPGGVNDGGIYQVIGTDIKYMIKDGPDDDKIAEVFAGHIRELLYEGAKKAKWIEPNLELTPHIALVRSWNGFQIASKMIDYNSPSKEQIKDLGILQSIAQDKSDESPANIMPGISIASKFLAGIACEVTKETDGNPGNIGVDAKEDKAKNIVIIDAGKSMGVEKRYITTTYFKGLLPSPLIHRTDNIADSAYNLVGHLMAEAMLTRDESNPRFLSKTSIAKQFAKSYVMLEQVSPFGYMSANCSEARACTLLQNVYRAYDARLEETKDALDAFDNLPANDRVEIIQKALGISEPVPSLSKVPFDIQQKLLEMAIPLLKLLDGGQTSQLYRMACDILESNKVTASRKVDLFTITMQLREPSNKRQAQQLYELALRTLENDEAIIHTKIELFKIADQLRNRDNITQKQQLYKIAHSILNDDTIATNKKAEICKMAFELRDPRDKTQKHYLYDKISEVLKKQDLQQNLRTELFNLSIHELMPEIPAQKVQPSPRVARRPSLQLDSFFIDINMPPAPPPSRQPSPELLSKSPKHKKPPTRSSNVSLAGDVADTPRERPDGSSPQGARRVTTSTSTTRTTLVTPRRQLTKAEQERREIEEHKDFLQYRQTFLKELARERQKYSDHGYDNRKKHGSFLTELPVYAATSLCSIAALYAVTHILKWDILFSYPAAMAVGVGIQLWRNSVYGIYPSHVKQKDIVTGIIAGSVAGMSNHAAILIAKNISASQVLDPAPVTAIALTISFALVTFLYDLYKHGHFSSPHIVP